MELPRFDGPENDGVDMYVCLHQKENLPQKLTNSVNGNKKEPSCRNSITDVGIQ